MSKEDADQETSPTNDSSFIEPETGYGSPPKYDQGTGYPHLAYVFQGARDSQLPLPCALAHTPSRPGVSRADAGSRYPGGPEVTDGDTFTWQEMRVALTAFALWLLKDEPGEGREVELVDKFIEETT